MPDVSICSPVYRAHAAPNLGTLAASLPAALDGLEGELVVALNGISAAAAGAPASVTTVDLGINKGVAPGWNAAAKAASADILCFANDDVVLGPNALRLLVNALREQPDAGVVGPTGTRWDIAGARHLDWLPHADSRPGELQSCEVISGFLFACRREVYERVGGFDEYYAPFSWEEVDFCTAVRAQGLRCYQVAGVEHDHEFGISKPQPPWRRARWNGRSQSIWWIHRRNRRHFLRKWRDAAPSEL